MNTAAWSRITLAFLLTVAASVAVAQPWPQKPVKIVIPLAAGGGTDTIVRLLADRLRGVLGQPVIVQNIGGAGTLIGTDAVAKAPADGYTLLAHNDLLPVFPLLYAKLAFDPAKDFTPLTIYASGPIVLVAHPSLPAKSVQELVALARKQPGSISMATAGLAASHTFAGMLFSHQADVKFNYIPYKGNGPALTDLVGGHVALGLFSLPSVTQFAKDGRIRMLAVFDRQRHPLAPEVPSMAEAGQAGVERSVSYLMSGPAGLPKPVVATLQSAFAQIAKDSSYRAELARTGFDPQFTTAEDTAQILQRERGRWAPILKAFNVVPE